MRCVGIRPATSSVTDCAGDSLVRIVTVGDNPWGLLAGPQGKVYCGGLSSVLTVIDGGETRTIPVGGPLMDMSYDATNEKVYYATFGPDIVVVDAVGDSVLARVEPGEARHSLCYDPVGNSTWAASWREATVSMIDGETDRLNDTLWFGSICPAAFRYNPLNNHLYCLAQGNDWQGNLLLVLDGNTNQLLKVLPAGSSTGSIIWNPANNKVYFSNSGDRTVSIVDCANDSTVATIGTGGDWPEAMCCSDDGSVYVVNEGGGVTVIDPSGDTVRGVVPVGDSPRTICYDRNDSKVYVGKWNGDSVSVIDATTDSVVATVPTDLRQQVVCWNQNHDKVYVASSDDSRVVVIDCESDTILKSVAMPAGLWRAYSDSASDKVYFADVDGMNLRIVDPATDSFYRSLRVVGAGAMGDNGRTGPANRLYCADYDRNSVVVVDGATDSILRCIQVEDEPVALAWNPVRSWVYVSNSGSASITVIRDSLVVGVEEGTTKVKGEMTEAATVVRGVLFLDGDCPRTGTVPKAALLDIGGRKVLDLKPGANDVRALAPGVYFVRDARAQAQAQAVRMVVIAK